MIEQEQDLDVLCFGEAIVDFMPTSRGRPLEEIEGFSRHLGGAPANVAVGLARLGCKAGLMTLVGADAFGRFLRAALMDEGVDVTGVGVHDSARTGITFVSVDAAGQRSFVFYRHPSADMLIEPVDVDVDLIGRAKVFHFGSSTLSREPARAATLAALASAKDAGVLVSCDPNLRLHLWDHPETAKDLVLQTLADCNLVKLSDDESPFLFGPCGYEEAAAALRELGVAFAVVTMGARGTFLSCAAGTAFLPSEKVEVVDTTGAGDGFVAGLWTALLPRLALGKTLESLSLEDVTTACRYANRVAARTVMAFGATAALPRKEELSL